MNINRIEGITVDSSNKVFGGFIYNIDYSTSAGDSPSIIKLTLLNEAGEYFIGPEDLTTLGSPTEIKIGTQITVKMFPVSYRFEKSPSGRLLEIEYVDESIIHLDKNYVGLAGRQAPHENVILVGSPKYRENKFSLELIEDEGSENVSNIFNVPDILYTFPELLSKIQNILGIVPDMTQEYNNFYKDYIGSLRQVLSAWSNDLGFMFYWENDKINFVDLRNPNHYQVVKQGVDNLIESLGLSSVEESFSIRDTFVRGLNSNFAKNGEYRSEEPKQGTIGLTYLAMEDINGMPTIFDSEGGSETIQNRIKAAHYGIDFLFASMLYREGRYTATDLLHPTIRSSIGSYKFLNSADAADNLKINLLNRNFGSEITGRNFSTLIEFTKTNAGELDSFVSKYRSLADWQGRFFWARDFYNPIAQFDSNLIWFHEDVKMIDTPFNKYLAPFKDIITNYETVTIKGVIRGTGETAPNYDEEAEIKKRQGGYYIKEVEPHWYPESVENIVTLSDKALIIEVDGVSGFEDNSFILALENFNNNIVDAIKFPDKGSINVAGGDPKIKLIGGWDDYLQFTSTNYPDNFSSANVMNIDMLQNEIPEDVIKAFSDDLNNPEISLENFNRAHDFYSNITSFEQSGPFFSKNFSIPYINLLESPSIGKGFQSLSISIGNNGVESSYVFGTENMKIRNSEFYLSNFYDSKKKEVVEIERAKIILYGRFKQLLRGL